jgi:hypothetical protein
VPMKTSIDYSGSKVWGSSNYLRSVQILFKLAFTPMKSLTTVLFACLLSASCTEQSPSEISDSKISKYQSNIEIGCKKRGRQKGDPEKMVDEFCECMLATLKASVSLSDWQRAYVFALQRDATGEQQVFSEHLKEVEACK